MLTILTTIKQKLFKKLSQIKLRYLKKLKQIIKNI